MKTLSIFLALINSLLAGLIIMYNLSVIQLYESGTYWFLIESLIDLSVIMVGVFTWFTCMREVHSGPVLIGGLYLVVLGAVTIVWTYHLAVLSGHMQYTMVIFGVSLMAQGLSSMLGFSAESRSMTTS
ncbi:MAG TPA: hypothetical protein VLA72_14410 [Anaerolineales bacterium]|nr:hypothetical protein [Anaerolineales bacterium]